MRTARLYSVVVAFIVFGIVVGGCHRSDPNAKVTAGNLAKIHPGMSLVDVEEILGTGEAVQTAFANVDNQRVPAEQRVWTEGERTISIAFVNGKVISSGGQHL